MSWEAVAGGAAAVGLAAFSARYTWWRRPRRGVPILMYHHVTDRLDGTRLAKLRVSPAAFERQLDWLLDQGYQAVTLSRALGPRPPEKPVVLTFDDGYADFHRRAWPLLRSRRMNATVFLVTGALGGVNHWDRDKEPTEELLSRSQILELAAAGVEFGGHTHSHCELEGLEPRRLMLEITGCQKVLTDLLGGPARTFSYPYGRFDQTVQAAVLRAGFTLACTTAPGKARPAADRLTLPRIIIKRADTMLDFRLKLSRARSRL